MPDTDGCGAGSAGDPVKPSVDGISGSTEFDDSDVDAGVVSAAFTDLLPEAGSAPNTVTGVVVAAVAPLPNIVALAGKPLCRGAQSNMLGSCFTPFFSPSSLFGAASVSALTLAPKTGAFPFDETEKDSISGSCLRSEANTLLDEAICPNGDSDELVVAFAYSAKGGSLTRGFLASVVLGGFEVSGSSSCSLVLLVGDVSSEQVSAGSVV